MFGYKLFIEVQALNINDVSEKIAYLCYHDLILQKRNTHKTRLLNMRFKYIYLEIL